MAVFVHGVDIFGDLNVWVMAVDVKSISPSDSESLFELYCDVDVEVVIGVFGSFAGDTELSDRMGDELCGEVVAESMRIDKVVRVGKEV